MTGAGLWLGMAALVAALAANAALAGSPPSFPTPHDDIPNFAQSPTIRSVAAGAWTAPATWNLGRIPNANDVVLIEHDVSYAGTGGIADVVGIDTNGVLRFATNTTSELRTGVLLVMPGGALEIGTAAAPVAPDVTATLVIRNRALGAADTAQYGTGLLAIDGRVTMHGAVKSPTFVRLAAAPTATQTSLVLASPVSGWRTGDRLLLPDSRQLRTEDTGVPRAYGQEELTLGSIVGTTLTFTPALAITHPGTGDEDGVPGPDFLPHVANRDRNVTVRSESRTGTRGHVLLTGRSNVDIRYAQFVDLGRTTFEDLDPVTNRIGRYALHLHHLYGPFPTVDPEYQYRLVGNAVYEDAAATPPQKWGIAIHDTHYGLIRDNVVYNVGGAAFVTEDGSESQNLFERNFAMRVLGNGARSEVDESGRGVAREGVGFWFRGTNNRVVDNIAVNMIEGDGEVEAAYGFKYNMTQLGDVRVPNFRGAGTVLAGEYTTRDGNAMPLFEFARNETYGQIQGLTFWWLCSRDFDAVEGCGVSRVSDMRIWHVSRYAYYGYPAFNQVFERLRVHGDPVIAAGNNLEFRSVFWFGDYGTKDLLITDARFYDTVGLNPPYFRDGFIRVEGSFFRATEGILHRKSGAEGSCPFCDLPDPVVVVDNNRYAQVGARPLRSISLEPRTTDAANLDRLVVCNHGGVVGDHFEVFFPTQGNAPCAATRADVEGFVCPSALAAQACNDLLFANGYE